MSAPAPELKTRKPTGKPTWPIMLLAGAEKAGKSYGAALASASDLIGRTYWITIGEDDPDEYGQIGDFDIVDHDGTYRGILEAIHAAALQPKPDQGEPLLVIDSMSRLWELIAGHAQDVANERAAKKGRASRDQDAQITMDLWNAAKDQWQRVMDEVRLFPGPSILTARLDKVAVMDDRGQPTTAKDLKVQAHKSLPFDAGVVVEMPARGEVWLTGVRSVKLKLEQRTRAPMNFTVDWLWRQMGLAGAETAPREHTAPKKTQKPKSAPVADLPRDLIHEALEDGLLPKEVVADEWAGRVAEADSIDALFKLHAEAADRKVLDHRGGDGRSVEEVFVDRREQLQLEDVPF